MKLVQHHGADHDQGTVDRVDPAQITVVFLNPVDVGVKILAVRHLRQMADQAKFVIDPGLYNDAVYTEPLGGIYADVDTCGEVYGPGRHGTGGGAIRLPRLKT